MYALGPLEGLRVRRLLDRMDRYTPPAAAPGWSPTAMEPEPEHQSEAAHAADPAPVA
jgi:hypothetical protein